MKTYLFFLVFSITFLAYSQELAIELSVEWRKNNIPLIYEEETTAPFLKVSFRNLSDENIYFKNPLYNKSVYPKITSLSIHRPNRDFETLKKIYKSHKNDTLYYKVMIDSSFLILDELEYKNLVQQKEISTTYSADVLYMLYALFKLQEFYFHNDLKKQSLLFKYDNKETLIESKELKKDIIAMERLQQMEKLRRQDSVSNVDIIYLKAQECKEVYFNLIGFKIIGGEYEFCLNFKKINDLPVFTNKDNQEEDVNKISNEFNLYKGSFLSNTVKINFNSDQ